MHIRKNLFKIIIAILAVSLVLPINTVFADSSAKTIVISLSEKNDSSSVPLYKKTNNKMVKTSKHQSIFTDGKKDKVVKHHNATEVKVDGKTYWKIGKNKYIRNSSRVHVVKNHQSDSVKNS